MLKREISESLFFALNLYLIVLPAGGFEPVLIYDNRPFRSITLGGVDGRGGEGHAELGIVNTFPGDTQRYETLKGRRIDLGQANCIRHFEDQLARDDKFAQSRTIFYGTSQGAATLLNWLGQKPPEEQDHLAEGLVLESVFDSGNSAIMQATRAFLPLGSLVAGLPLSRMLLPLLAKTFVYQSYCPCGLQPVSSAAKISPNIPVVIMHNRGDKMLSISGARAVYCSLVGAGHKKTYLIEVDNEDRHLNILRYPRHRKAQRNEILVDLQNIFLKEGLPVSARRFSAHKNITKYQPSWRKVKWQIRLNPASVGHGIVDSGALVTAAYFAGRALI